MWKTVLAISFGAALGALMRWQLGVRLNALLPGMPPGTLLANLLGGFLVGLATAYFSQAPGIPAEWRLFLITGFCGGLTTFSTFSAEAFHLLQRGALGWLGMHVAVHVAGSVLMTWAGYALFNALRP